MIKRPQPDEYSAYAARYVDLVGNDHIVDLLETQKEETFHFFTRLSSEKADYAYAAGKWTVKQVLGHMIDTERVFAFRAFAFSREAIELPGFDQNVYINHSNYHTRTLQDLADEFKTVRASSLFLLRSLTEEQSTQKGIASGNPVSVRALAYMMAGHAQYHLQLIRDKYL